MESESHRLVHSLTAHLALYHSHASKPNPNTSHRVSILRWFSSLSPAHRQAALSVADSSFIQIILQMQSRIRRQGHSHFLLLPDLLTSSQPPLPSLCFRSCRGLLSRSAASNLSALLLSNTLLFFSPSLCSAAPADVVTVSESLVTDVDYFVGVMDGISGGMFLCEEVEMMGLTVHWAELLWLKNMGYYSLEAFLANRFEVALRLSWFSSQGGKKHKEKRLKERAAEVAGQAANVFWRMKSCVDWWVGLDPGLQKVIISVFLGKAAKSLANEIVREENTSLENVFGFLDIGKYDEISYGDLLLGQKPKRSLFRRGAGFGLHFLPSRVPNSLAVIWKKMVVVQDISSILLAWQSSRDEAEKLFSCSLHSVFTVSDHIMRILQKVLMAVYTNLISYELMDDEKLNILPEKKDEKKSSLGWRKGKSKCRSSKKTSAMLKSYNTTSTSQKSSKNVDCSTELCNKDSTSSLVSERIIDDIISITIDNVPEVKALAAQKVMDNRNARDSNDCKEGNGKRKNRRKGPKNKCSNIKNIGKPKLEEKDAFISIATERELTGTINYMCSSNSQPKSVDALTCNKLIATSISDIPSEYVMVDMLQSGEGIEECRFISLTRDGSTTNEECHPFSGKSGSDMSEHVSSCLRKCETSLQTTYSSSTVPNQQIDSQLGLACETYPHTLELDNVDPDSMHENLVSRVARVTASKSFVSKECLHTAADDGRSVTHNGGSECYTFKGINSMGGTSYEWPSITSLHFPTINSHFPATDRLHLDGVRLPYDKHQAFIPSETHVRNSFGKSAHSQILPSLTYPMSYEPSMVKNCSISGQTQSISYESAYSQSLPTSFYSRLASCAVNGMQINVASGDNEVKRVGDIVDVFDMKSISDLVEDESYSLSEDEVEPHARSGRDYNKYFGGGIMYWNPTELVGIGFSRPPSHSSEDSSWAWHEADLNRTIDDMVGCKSVLPTYNTNGRASPPSSYCSPFDNFASGHQSLSYAVAGNDGSNATVQSTSLSWPDEKIVSSTANSTSCIEGVKGDPSPYPMLRPIIIPGMSRKGSRSDLKLGLDNKSPCLSSARGENSRIRRPPSPVVLCVPRVPRPPLYTVGESRRRGFPIVRSGSSSPRHCGVKSWCHEKNFLADTHFCLEGAEVVWPAWTRKGLGITAVAQSLQGSLLHDHLFTISQLARDLEHPDLAFPLQPPDLLSGPWKGSLSMMHNLLHEEIDLFCKMVSTKNLIHKPYINWAVKRVTRSLQVLWPRSRTNIFGSNATGLALPTSDVDLVVSLPPVRNLEPIKEAGILEGRNGIKETCLQHATRYLANQEWVRNDSLKTIENTTIPLIILVAEVPCDMTLSHGTSSVVDTSKEKSSEIYGEHNSASLLNLSGVENGVTAKTSRITRDGAAVGSKSVHLDISFKSTSHTGLQTSELVRELTQQFPASIPLALVLKKFLADRSLDHSYSGGLSSYCLVLLITRFLQHEHHRGHSMKQNLGSLLMDFLFFFGNVFDPRHMRISIQGSGVYMKRERGHSIDPIHIDDPLFPANNVGRNCFRIHQCIKAFADAFAALEDELPLISDESVPASTQSFRLLKKIVPSIDCDE